MKARQTTGGTTTTLSERTAAKIWLAMKRLNRRYDAWQARIAAGIVAKLDHPRDLGNTLPGHRHIIVWDLLSTKRERVVPPAVSPGDK